MSGAAPNRASDRSSERDNVYLLHHVRGEQEEEVKLIGVYRSRANAAAAVSRLKTKPGFCDHVEGFQIEAYALDVDHWTEGFVSEPFERSPD